MRAMLTQASRQSTTTGVNSFPLQKLNANSSRHSSSYNANFETSDAVDSSSGRNVRDVLLPSDDYAKSNYVNVGQTLRTGDGWSDFAACSYVTTEDSCGYVTSYDHEVRVNTVG